MKLKFTMIPAMAIIVGVLLYLVTGKQHLMSLGIVVGTGGFLLLAIIIWSRAVAQDFALKRYIRGLTGCCIYAGLLLFFGDFAFKIAYEMLRPGASDEPVLARPGAMVLGLGMVVLGLILSSVSASIRMMRESSPKPRILSVRANIAILLGGTAFLIYVEFILLRQLFAR